MPTRKAIREYRAALDAALLTGSVPILKRLMVRHGVPYSDSDQVVEITMHKTITGSTSLPLDYRRRSKAWLGARGYHSLDDGELKGVAVQS